jgi:hypothetical protein
MRRVVQSALGGIGDEFFGVLPDLRPAVRGIVRRVPLPPRLVAAGQFNYVVPQTGALAAEANEAAREAARQAERLAHEAGRFVPCPSVTETSVILLTPIASHISRSFCVAEIRPGDGFCIGEAYDPEVWRRFRDGTLEQMVHWCVLEP